MKNLQIILFLVFFNAIACFAADNISSSSSSSSSSTQLTVQEKFKQLQLKYNLRDSKFIKGTATPDGKYIFYANIRGDCLNLDIIENVNDLSVFESVQRNFDTDYEIKYLESSNEYCVCFMKDASGFYLYLYDIANKIDRFIGGINFGELKFFKIINNCLITINSENVLGIYDLHRFMNYGCDFAYDIESHTSAKEFSLKFNKDKVLVDFGKTKIGFDFTTRGVFRDQGGALSFDIKHDDTSNPNHPTNSLYASRLSHGQVVDRGNIIQRDNRNVLASFGALQQIADPSLIHEITFGDGRLLVKFKDFEKALDEGQQCMMEYLLAYKDQASIILTSLQYDTFKTLPLTLQKALVLNYDIINNIPPLEEVSSSVSNSNSTANEIVQFLGRNRREIGQVITAATLFFLAYKQYQKYIQK